MQYDDFPLKQGFAGPDWSLEDCIQANSANPNTFSLPNINESSMVKVGDLLRLHFLVTANNHADNELPRAERMWVEVCDILDSDVFRGYLTNEPNVIQSLNPGDVIEFSWRHVAQVFVKKNDPRHPEYSSSDR